MSTINPVKKTAGGDGTDAQGFALRFGWYLCLLAFAIPLTVFHYAASPVWKWAAPERMVELQAASPFQQRILMPAIVGTIQKAAPWLDLHLLFAAAEVAAWMMLIVIAHCGLRAFRIGPPGLPRRLLAMTVVVPVAMHLIVPDFKVVSSLSTNGGDLGLGEWKLVPYFRYVYDLPAAVFILGLVILLKRFADRPDSSRFLAYLGLFALATVNRETTLFMLPAFFVACFGVIGRNLLVLCVAAQAAVFATVHGLVKWFAPGLENSHAAIPATNYENHFLKNLELFSDPLYLLIYLVRFGAGLYLVVLLLHRHVDPVLKRALLAFGIPLFASALLVGRIVEHRVVIELIPILWLAAVQGVMVWCAEQSRMAEFRPERSA
ncbi:hypothetical protein [Paracoccus alkanivorans]|uniref:Uncharacterized protein n=1 Tax=Paracoccus alkanivorans TaxID=2116655 RepID=A0A3M0M5E5_9RHOB|nr:hypothetical protein [Paracoccus alkanivorans]RMC32463.1 hypothetical protein C9E81_18995 [Paracoccus alkanivorans]